MWKTGIQHGRIVGRKPSSNNRHPLQQLAMPVEDDIDLRGATTWRRRPSIASPYSKRRPERRARTAVRILCDSGGGGSRTRVRKWILQSLYVRSVTQCFARGGERATGPQASYLNISSLTGAAPARDQPDSSTSRKPASGRQIRKRTTNRSYAANASSLLAIKVFQGVLRGPRNLGTLLHIHQTRRSRDAPDVLPAYGRPTCNISLMD